MSDDRCIGLDVGGVIIDSRTNDNTDTAFRSDNFLATTAVEGAFESIRSLVEMYGKKNVFIISKCGRVIENKTRLWLIGKHFYRLTGFDPVNLFFCLTRAEKAPIAKRLRLTDYVDDHADVLGYMEGIVSLRYLFGPQPERKDTKTAGLIARETWKEMLPTILGQTL
jgi:hypothetical protein